MFYLISLKKMHINNFERYFKFFILTPLPPPQLKSWMHPRLSNYDIFYSRDVKLLTNFGTGDATKSLSVEGVHTQRDFS